MDIGQYNAKRNKCRNFVKKAFEILRNEPECSKIIQIGFNQKMKEIEDEDKEKVEKGRLAIIFGVLLTSALAAFQVRGSVNK